MIHFPIQCHLVVTSAELSILSVFLNVKLDSKHARRGEFGTGTFNRPLRDVDVWPSAKCLELLYRKFESAPQKVLEKTILESYYKIRALNCAPSFSMYDIRATGGWRSSGPRAWLSANCHRLSLEEKVRMTTCRLRETLGYQEIVWPGAVFPPSCSPLFSASEADIWIQRYPLDRVTRILA